tara:strand:- start:239 stop:1252 length:1014 start_codon:yes stop_codon:yes gene_type:complete
MLDILLIAIIAIIIGANDASNVFGSAVGSKMLKFKIAIIFFIIFIILGAIINAENPSQIYANLILDYPDLKKIFLIIIPVVIVTIISLKLKIPSSISQSIIFSLIGFSFVENLNINYDLFLKLIYFWIATPLIAFLLSILFCWIINLFFKILKLNIFQIDYQIRLSLILFGCIAAFALGPHLTAAIVGIYAPFLSLNLDIFNFNIIIDEEKLFFFGSLLIGAGAFLFSQKIVRTIGSQISNIKPVPALAILLTQILILFSFSVYPMINTFNSILPFEIFPMPLSASHITFASIIGIASFNKFREVKPKHTIKIILSWIIIPISVFCCSFLLTSIYSF